MNQLCKVCAEPAAGFHFGAFTCEGCKSFFGRTYNNLSQIHECKNGGQCVINKQNRTSCKACRLRKCLIVGMSKTGSRYGRRSNWFKIHCLLQEQCAYSSASSPTPSFRSPVTPTLQDGSLPFVNSQLRDALHSMDGDQGVPSNLRIPITSPNDGAPLLPPTCTPGGGVAESHFTGNFTMGQMGEMERRLQDEALSALRRGAGISGSNLEASYREQLFEAIRRSHSLQPQRQFDPSVLQTIRRTSPETEQVRRLGVEFERIRRASAESETRLRVIPSYEWDRRFEETPVFTTTETIKPTSSPHDSKSNKNVKNMGENDCPTSCVSVKLECPVSNSENICKKVKDEHNTGRSSTNRSPSKLIPKTQGEPTRIQEEVETPMTEEERLSFLKSASKVSANNCAARDTSAIINSFQGIPSIIPHRPTSREDILYSPLNNNLFPFPSYPPVWPSILPFPSLAKFYAPFNSASMSNSTISFDGFKNTVLLPPELRTTMLTNIPSEQPKPDPSSKKRILDAILQVQRESSCGIVSPSSVALSLPQHVTTTSAMMPIMVSTATTASHGDQPIDLTVRRKRKMAKSDILYQPTEEEDMESEYDREEESQDREQDEIIVERLSKEIIVKGTSEIVDLKTTLECSTSISETKFEVPMKIMKLETSGDPLLV